MDINKKKIVFSIILFLLVICLYIPASFFIFKNSKNIDFGIARVIMVDILENEQEYQGVTYALIDNTGKIVYSTQIPRVNFINTK